MSLERLKTGLAGAQRNGWRRRKKKPGGIAAALFGVLWIDCDGCLPSRSITATFATTDPPTS
jgi:hypothetical protein